MVLPGNTPLWVHTMYQASIIDGQMPKRIFKGTWRLLLLRSLAKQSRISKLHSCLKPSFDRIGAWANNVCRASNTYLSLPLSYLLPALSLFFKLQEALSL